MKRKLSGIILSVLAILIGLAGFYIFQCKSNWCSAIKRPIENLIKYQSIYAPCDQPILYSLGAFDVRFGLSKTSLLSAIKEAEAVWEKPINKQLFLYDAANGNLKINLIYDYRQQATVKLNSLGIVVREDQASYDDLKAKYLALNAAYLQAKNDYNLQLAAFNQSNAAYNQEVQSWNKKGGAPQAEYDRLQTEAAALQTELANIRQLETNLNNDVDNLNAMVVTLNHLADTLNLSADKFNTIGAARGGEFTEGDYQYNNGAQSINIYEFSNRDKLVRVLAHEFGHALGLEHVADPRAIMYKLNSSTNINLTADDLSELKTRCGLK